MAVVGLILTFIDICEEMLTLSESTASWGDIHRRLVSQNDFRSGYINVVSVMLLKTVFLHKSTCLKVRDPKCLFCRL